MCAQMVRDEQIESVLLRLEYPDPALFPAALRDGLGRCQRLYLV